MAPVSKAKLQPRMKQWRTDYDKLRADYKRLASGKSERDQLLGGGMDDQLGVDTATMDQRERLLQNTNRLNNTSRRLEESHRVALETEQIGTSTLETLRQ